MQFLDLSQVSHRKEEQTLEKWLWYRTHGDKFQFNPAQFSAEHIIKTAKDGLNMIIEQIDHNTLIVTGVEGGVQVEHKGGTVYRHPSYGVASFSRRSGTSSEMFGSNIEHGSCVSLTISNAELIRDDLHTEWVHDDKQIIEVEFSPHQFAELLTQMNYGSGVPCTIRWSRAYLHERTGAYPDSRIRYQPPYDKNVRAEAERIVKEACDKISEDASEGVEKVEEILAKKSIGKQDRETILKVLKNTANRIKSSLPFAESQFHESVGKTITQAKAEVDATITNAVMQLGGEELAKRISKGALAGSADEMLAIDVEPGGEDVE